MTAKEGKSRRRENIVLTEEGSTLEQRESWLAVGVLRKQERSIARFSVMYSSKIIGMIQMIQYLEELLDRKEFQCIAIAILSF